MQDYIAAAARVHESSIVYILTVTTDGNTKLCCQGFVWVLFQSTTVYKINSEYTQDDMKLFPVCKVGKLQVTVNKIKVLSSF